MIEKCCIIAVEAFSYPPLLYLSQTPSTTSPFLSRASLSPLVPPSAATIFTNWSLKPNLRNLLGLHFAKNSAFVLFNHNYAPGNGRCEYPTFIVRGQGKDYTEEGITLYAFPHTRTGPSPIRLHLRHKTLQALKLRNLTY